MIPNWFNIKNKKEKPVLQNTSCTERIQPFSVRARKLYLAAEERKYIYDIQEGIHTLGRTCEMADFFQDFPKVARCQAILLCKSGRTMISGCGALNSNYINGVKIGNTWTELELFDTVQLADCHFYVHLDGVPTQIDKITVNDLTEDPIIGYTGYTAHATGTTDHIMIADVNSNSFNVIQHAVPGFTPMVLANSIHWYSQFTDEDIHPMTSPEHKVRLIEEASGNTESYIIFDNATSFSLYGHAKYRIRINSDGSFLFFMNQKLVAEFKKEFNPSRRHFAYGEALPARYTAWCSAYIPRDDQIAMLSTPFLL